MPANIYRRPNDHHLPARIEFLGPRTSHQELIELNHSTNPLQPAVKLLDTSASEPLTRGEVQGPRSGATILSEEGHQTSCKR